jgi:hypothetical protein
MQNAELLQAFFILHFSLIFFMLSYSDIIKKSYYITIEYPILWLFGIFVVGGSNLNFLSYENIPLKNWYEHKNWLDYLLYFQQHPLVLGLLSLSVLLGSLASLVLTNWSRIILLLAGESILKNKRADYTLQFKKSLSLIWPVIKISLWTAGLMLLVAAALFLPLLFLDLTQSIKFALLSIASVIFLPLAFTISCINIFTTFYLVIFKKPIGSSIDLGTDFFVSRWPQILGLVLILSVIYCASFIMGVSLLYIAQVGLQFLLAELIKFNIFPFSAIIMGLKLVSRFALWFLIGGLSVFFNQALLLLFFELNTPIKIEEADSISIPATNPTI